MKIIYPILICALLLLAGCTASKNSDIDANSGELEDAGQAAEQEQPTEGNESTGTNLEEKMFDVNLMKGGFEKTEMKVGKVSRITIINEDKVMHKLNGGDLFWEQFNTNIKSIFGIQDSLGRNKLNVVFLEAGEYEIKDLTSNSILKVIVG